MDVDQANAAHAQMQAALAQIAELQQDVQRAAQYHQEQMQQQQQQHTMQSQQMQIEALQAQLAAGRGSVHSRGPTMRIAHAPSYDGSSLSLENWSMSMAQQFAYHQLASDADQVRTAAAHLKGPALDWWLHLAGAHAEPTTMEGIVAGLRERFQPITSAEAARDQLHALVQGKLSVSEYVAQFRRLIVQIPTMDAATQMHQFARGLKPAIQVSIRQQQPLTLDASIALAVRTGYAMMPTQGTAASSGTAGAAMDLSALRVALFGNSNDDDDDDEASRLRSDLCAMMQGGSRNNGSGSHGRGAQGASGGFQAPRGLPTIKGMTPQKVKEYMDVGRCFGCHQIGHRSNRCPTRKVDASGKVSWGN